jgi:2-methylisocitrate lyase-like PEP mutase family enzyme
LIQGDDPVTRLKELIAGDELIVAPCVLNPIMAKMAEEAGFKAVYLSGGSLGWVKCVTEANLTLPELAEVAVDMRAACKLPIVLDAGGGWGDPVHQHRTVALSEAAGFDAIEIEDQVLPRRVHHHIGVEHLVEPEFVAKRIAEAVAARTDPNMLIVGRTNALRLESMDSALRRCELMKKAGADMIFVHTRNAEETRAIGERLDGPLMIFAPADGYVDGEITKQELYDLGFRLAASSGSSFAAFYKAVQQSYRCLAEGTIDPFLGKGGASAAMKEAHATCGLPELLEIEKRTMGD